MAFFKEKRKEILTIRVYDNDELSINGEVDAVTLLASLASTIESLVVENDAISDKYVERFKTLVNMKLDSRLDTTRPSLTDIFDDIMKNIAEVKKKEGVKDGKKKTRKNNSRSKND